MRKPTLEDFLIRVGGAFFVLLSAILITKYYFPIYTGVAFFTVIIGGFIFLIIEEVLKRKTKNEKQERNTNKNVRKILATVGMGTIAFIVSTYITKRIFDNYELSSFFIALACSFFLFSEKIHLKSSNERNKTGSSRRKRSYWAARANTSTSTMRRDG